MFSKVGCHQWPLNLRIISFVSIVSLLGWSESLWSAVEKVSEPPIEVTSLIIQEKSLQPVVKYPVQVIPLIHGNLVSEVPGLVKKIYKGLGEKVKLGERIFTVRNVKSSVHFNNYTVVAPVSGTISTLGITVGQYVEASQVAGTVTDLKQIKFSAHAPGEDLSNIKIGLKAQIELYKKSFSATVTGVSPIVNPKTGTSKIELRAEISESFAPGSVGKVILYLESFRAISVPGEALISKGTKHYLRVISKKNLILLQKVELGRLINGQQIITSGVKAQQEVVVRTSQFLKDGDLVTINNLKDEKSSKEKKETHLN